MSVENYQKLLEYVLTTDQLKIEGYPLRDLTYPGVMAQAYFSPKYDFNRKIFSMYGASKRKKRLCRDCFMEYSLDNNLQQEQYPKKCQYHIIGPKYNNNDYNYYRNNMIYKCCKQSTPCTFRNYHVSENDEYLYPFKAVETQNEPISNNVPLIVGLDCEMIYTELGGEVARVSMVNFDGFQIFDELVKPTLPVLDYVTTFSGLTAAHFDKPGIKLLPQIQEELLKIIKADTIIIGHSLDNDLRALKLIHTKCVDTSVIFNKPFKRWKPSLKKLAAEHLEQKIQEGQTGHDSCTDARTVVKLIRKRMNLPF